MTEPAPVRVRRKPGDFSLTPRDIEKLAALKRMRIIATSLLVFSVCLLVVAKLLEHRHPAWGFVAAFAEAATIGGIADWYAIVALFKHPMGLPIPHTAIIPENRDRIAQSLGEFVETQFLAPAPVEAKLREVDFAGHVSNWLADSEKSGSLSGFALKLVPQAVAALEKSGLRDFVAGRISAQIEKIEIAPMVADLMTTFTQDGRHQQLLDELLGAIDAILGNETTLEVMREKIRSELPSLFNLFRADSFLLDRIVKSTVGFIEDVRADPNHPLRGEFDSFVQRFIAELHDSPDYAARAEKLKRDLLARPQLKTLANDMWKNLRDFLDQDVRSPNSAIQAQLTRLLVDVGRQLKLDPVLAREINDGFVTTLTSFVETQKSSVSLFIAEQVKSWNITHLIRVIEINMGKDLQYIRLNGTLIGGIIGLLLHTIEVIFKFA